MGPAKKENKLNLNIDIKGMDEVQIRMLKRVTSMLVHVMTTNDEGEYFEGSSELLKLVASSIKDSNFSKIVVSEIPYATQALEYSLDNLTDHIHAEKIVGWDN